MAEKKKAGTAKKAAPKKKLQVKKSSVKDLTRSENIKGGMPMPNTYVCRD